MIARRFQDELELSSGVLLVALAAVLGLWLSGDPRGNWFDSLGLFLIKVHPQALPYQVAAFLGSAPVLAIGILLATLAALLTDRRRVVTCLLGPALAILIADQIAKPLVHRQLVAGNLSYPSGTVAAVAAVAAAAVLVLPARARLRAGLVAVVIELLVGVAVVGLGWHDPTDVLGGMLLGTGCVAVVDSLAHVGRRPRRRSASLRTGARPSTGRARS